MIPINNKVIDEILNGDFVGHKRSFNSFGHQVLDLSSVGKQIKYDSYEILDDLLISICANLEHHDLIRKDKNYDYFVAEDVEKTLGLIHNEVKEYGFEIKSNNKFFDETLVDRIIDCDDFSFIYKSVADILQYPVSIINVPNHNTVLWKKEKENVYFEVLENKISSKEELKKIFNISGRSIYRGIYLKPLTRKKSLGLVLQRFAANLFNERELNESEEYWKLSVDLNPLDADAIANLGITYNLKGDLNKSCKCLKKSLNLNSRRMESLYYLAETHFEMENYYDAQKNLAKLLKMYPYNEDAHHLWGLIAVRLNSVEDAKIHFKKALEINPNYVFSHGELHKIYVEEKNIDKANMHKELYLKYSTGV